MNTTMPTTQADVAEVWPALPYEEGKDTLDTLHMWTQVVGKVKLALVPFLNEWWQVAFTVTARGLTGPTGRIPRPGSVLPVSPPGRLVSLFGPSSTIWWPATALRFFSMTFPL